MPGTAAGAAKARQKRESGVQAPEQVTPVEAPASLAKLEADRRLARRFGRSAGGVMEPTHYVVVRRPLSWEGLELQIGETVPGAKDWPRLDAWVRAGRIAPAYGERMTTSAEQEPVEAGQPEELEENIQSAPEDDDPTQYTGEPIPEEELAPLEEVSK